MTRIQRENLVLVALFALFVISVLAFVVAGVQA